MPLQIIRQDITKLKVDAIVNATNQKMLPDGGEDAAIHKAAGPELLKYCKKLGGVGVGEAKITPAFNIPAKYVIHTVGPVWKGGKSGERALLRSCYTECLNIAVQKKLNSIAFPLISSGLHGYPKSKVLDEAESVIKKFINKHEIDVYIVVYDKTLYSVNKKLLANVQGYVDNPATKSVSEKKTASPKHKGELDIGFIEALSQKGFLESYNAPKNVNYLAREFIRPRETSLKISKSTTPDVNEIRRMLAGIDKPFAETLFYYIDMKGMTDVQAYKGANVSRKAFSKLRCEKNYKPSKITAMSYAISLHLNFAEASHLLSTAGYAFSPSHRIDRVIEYFLYTGAYKDIHEINQILDQLDLPSLGCTK